LPVILDQKKVINAAYRMEFLTDTTWHVLRIRNAQVDTIVRNCIDLTLGTDSYIVDGILFKGQKISFDMMGVIRDPDPDSSELQTSGKGWTYTSSSGYLNLRGVDTARSAFSSFPLTFGQGVVPMQSMSMGLSWPSGTTYRQGYSSKIDAVFTSSLPKIMTGGFLKTYSLKRVKITFGDSSMAYRYCGNLGLTAQISPYRDMRKIPFKVEVDSPLDTAGTRRLNVGWMDRDSSTFWDPNDSPNGGAEIVFIFYSSYSETPTAPYLQDIGLLPRFKNMDILYVWWPRKINSGAPFQHGDVLTIYPYAITRKFINPGAVLTYDVSTAAPEIGNLTVAKERNELELIRVVPNPYFGGHSLETSPFDRFVKFTRLPKACNIYIYTLNGNLIRTLNKDDNNTTMNWDLLNTDQIPVASGIYIAFIDAPGIGTKIIKIAVFTPEERIDRF
jgi:hypothetical protein